MVMNREDRERPAIGLVELDILIDFAFTHDLYANQTCTCMVVLPGCSPIGDKIVQELNSTGNEGHFESYNLCYSQLIRSPPTSTFWDDSVDEGTQSTAEEEAGGDGPEGLSDDMAGMQDTEKTRIKKRKIGETAPVTQEPNVSAKRSLPRDIPYQNRCEDMTHVTKSLYFNRFAPSVKKKKFYQYLDEISNLYGYRVLRFSEKEVYDGVLFHKCKAMSTVVGQDIYYRSENFGEMIQYIRKERENGVKLLL